MCGHRAGLAQQDTGRFQVGQWQWTDDHKSIVGRSYFPNFSQFPALASKPDPVWAGGRKTWGECVKDDIKLLGLQPEWAVFPCSGRDVWTVEGLHSWGKRLTLAWRGPDGRFKNKW